MYSTLYASVITHIYCYAAFRQIDFEITMSGSNRHLSSSCISRTLTGLLTPKGPAVEIIGSSRSSVLRFMINDAQSCTLIPGRLFVALPGAAGAPPLLQRHRLHREKNGAKSFSGQPAPTEALYAGNRR